MGKIEYDDNYNTNSNSLGAKVFNVIQEDILNGKYRPGESIAESRLSCELGVSRTPVREAIRQLELEGLVKLTPNKGAVVKGISKQDIKDIYAIRMLIEGLAAKWAAQKISKEELEQLKETIELEEFYTLKGDSDHLIKLDTKFHEILFKASKSMPLMHTLSNFHNHLQKARASNMKLPGRAHKTLNEHRSILQAIIDCDEDMAEYYATQHVKNACVSLDEANGE